MREIGSGSSLSTLSCEGCPLNLDASQLLIKLNQNAIGLTALNLANTGLHGTSPFQRTAAIGSTDASSIGIAISPVLRSLSLANNPNLMGSLFDATGYNGVLSLVDLSNTGLTGAIPENWKAINTMERAVFTGAKLECQPQVGKHW